jgi:hypothetical protein
MAKIKKFIKKKTEKQLITEFISNFENYILKKKDLRNDLALF